MQMFQEAIAAYRVNEILENISKLTFNTKE